MRKIQSCFVLFSLFAGLCISSSAEFRSWTNNQGQSVEAEFAGIDGTSVVLRKRDGSKHKLPLDSLCESDQQLAMLSNPPKLFIKVDEDTKREKTETSSVGSRGGSGNSGRGGGDMDFGMGDMDFGMGGGGGNNRNTSKTVNSTITANVEVRKQSREAYDYELKQCVFLIGKEGNQYRILKKTEATFKLDEENKFTYASKCGPIEVQSTDNKDDSSVKYLGYLVVVCDKQGAIIAKESKRNEFKTYAESILGMNENATANKEFKVISSGSSASQTPRNTGRPAGPGQPGQQTGRQPGQQTGQRPGMGAGF